MKGNRQRQLFDWLGFLGKDLEATIDLGEAQKISRVTIDFLSNAGSKAYYPKNIEILVSKNGKKFKSVKEISTAEISKMDGTVSIDFKKQKAKFIKVIALNAGKIPEGKVGAGSDAWLFVDEIMVE